MRKILGVRTPRTAVIWLKNGYILKHDSIQIPEASVGTLQRRTILEKYIDWTLVHRSKPQGRSNLQPLRFQAEDACQGKSAK